MERPQRSNYSLFCLMIRRPPRSTRTHTLFPCTTLFRSACSRHIRSPSSAWISSRANGASTTFSVPAPKWRPEEHTSELQPLMRTSYAVFSLKKQTLMHSSYYVFSFKQKTQQNKESH